MLHYSDKKYTVLALAILLSFSAFSQRNGKEFRKLLWDANTSFEIGDYLPAKELYEKAYLLDTANNEVNFKLGVCKFELKKFRVDSKKNFDKVDDRDFPEVNYYLGLLNHLEKNFDKAISYFNLYQSFKGEKDHSAKEINDLIIKCYSARLLDSQKNNSVEMENLGKVINTEFPEYVPLIPADEKFLLFTARRKNELHDKVNLYGEYYEDIYISEKTDSGWSTPRVLDTLINTATHDACTGLSADGEKLLIYRTSKDLKSGDILESKFIGNKWTKPLPLKLNVNSSAYIESSACYSVDNDIVFFSSNRMGGFGGKDLYYVKKLPDGNWGIPRNLGSSINTEYNEDAPFVDALGKTLYFSSEGHTNMGGYDVFKSHFDERGYFSSPENLGSPINTVNDDIFFVLNPDSSIGYMSSERAGGMGSQDIYKIYFNDNKAILKVYNVHVVDEQDSIIHNVELVLSDPSTNAIVGQYKSNPNTGKVIVISRPDRHYSLSIQSIGFSTKTIANYSFNTKNELTFTLSKPSK